MPHQHHPPFHLENTRQRAHYRNTIVRVCWIFAVHPCHTNTTPRSIRKTHDSAQKCAGLRHPEPEAVLWSGQQQPPVESNVIVMAASSGGCHTSARPHGPGSRVRQSSR